MWPSALQQCHKLQDDNDATHPDSSQDCKSVQTEAGNVRMADRSERLRLSLVSGGGSHLVVVLQEPLKGLFRFFVFDPGLLLLLLLSLHLVGVEGLFLLTQLGKCALNERKGSENWKFRGAEL